MIKMANVFFVILFLGGISLDAQGQQGIITYKVGNTISKEEQEKIISEMPPEKRVKYGTRIREMNDYIKNLEYYLLFDSEKSLFYENKYLDEDSRNKLSYEFAVILISGNSSYWKNLKKKERIKQEESQGQFINVKEDFAPYKWNITDEKKVIAGYECTKAKGTIERMTMSGMKEQEIIAWFTKDIPVSFGPCGIDGLPGVILETTLKGSFYMYASKIHLGKDALKGKTISLPKGGEEIEQKKWDEFNRKEADKKRARF